MTVIIHTRFYSFYSHIIYKLFYVDEFCSCLHLSLIVIKCIIVF